MFWRLVSFLFVVIGLGFVATQMIVPQIKGTHWFPLFDRKRRELDVTTLDSGTDLENAETEKTISEIQAQTRKVRASAVEVEAQPQPPQKPQAKPTTRRKR